MNAKYIHIFGRFDRIREWKWVREWVSEWVRERERKAEAGRVSRHKGLAKSLPCTGTGKNGICVHMMRQKTRLTNPNTDVGQHAIHEPKTQQMEIEAYSTGAGFACFHWFTWALANMRVALAKGISAWTLPGLFTTFLALGQPKPTSLGGCKWEGKRHPKGCLLQLHNTQYDSHDFSHAMIFSMDNENHKGPSCSDLQKEGRLPARTSEKDGPVLGFSFFGDRQTGDRQTQSLGPRHQRHRIIRFDFHENHIKAPHVCLYMHACHCMQAVHEWPIRISALYFPIKNIIIHNHTITVILQPKQ